VNATNTDMVTPAAVVPVHTEPGLGGDAGDATSDVFKNLVNQGISSKGGVQITPIGTDTDDQTFNLRVYGWKAVHRGKSDAIWVPINLCEVLCTLGATTGVDGTIIPAAYLFCDTIALVTGNPNISIDINSPADDTIANFIIGLKGAQKLQLRFGISGGTAVSMNALLGLM
jgi:hypothetical protein